MYKGKLCLYFKCDYNIEINATTFNEIVSAINLAVDKYNIDCALNSCTTVFDLLFYKAIEACKVDGINIKNYYVKFGGRGGRRFDEYIRVFRSKKNSSIEDYIRTIGDICLDFTKEGVNIVDTRNQMKRRKI